MNSHQRYLQSRRPKLPSGALRIFLIGATIVALFFVMSKLSGSGFLGYRLVPSASIPESAEQIPGVEPPALPGEGRESNGEPSPVPGVTSVPTFVPDNKRSNLNHESEVSQELNEALDLEIRELGAVIHQTDPDNERSMQAISSLGDLASLREGLDDFNVDIIIDLLKDYSWTSEEAAVIYDDLTAGNKY